jgi:hypothetical protein
LFLCSNLGNGPQGRRRVAAGGTIRVIRGVDVGSGAAAQGIDTGEFRADPRHSGRSDVRERHSVGHQAERSALGSAERIRTSEVLRPDRFQTLGRARNAPIGRTRW